jgi:hypothetical protein
MISLFRPTSRHSAKLSASLLDGAFGKIVSFRSIHNSGSHSGTASRQQRVAATEKWFQSIVIGEKLCPFAPPLLKPQQGGRGEPLLRIVASEATNEQEAVRDVTREVRLLVGENTDAPAHETTLVVLDKTNMFNDFREFVRLSWTLQEEAVGDEFVDQLQLVLFHPNATHQTYATGMDDSPADYTIRSPYPTIHLLREVDVMKAVQGVYPNLESLPARNKAKLTEQGIETCQARLDACYDVVVMDEDDDDIT